MERGTESLTYQRVQAVTETADRLRDATGLKSVHIIPSELTNWEGWSDVPIGEDRGELFSQRLGRLAAPFIARELASTLWLNCYTSGGGGRLQPPSHKFRIGIAGGSTIHGLVQALVMPDNLPDQMHVEIVPLVVGPIPETMYSAGFIAEMLASKIPRSQFVEICRTKLSPKLNECTISMDPKWSEARENDHGARGALAFDWVLTGIGSTNSGQLDRHLGLLYGGQRPPGVIGDICSRLFGSSAVEVEEKTGDRFVAISLKWLNYLSVCPDPGRRVIAVAGGHQKYDAIEVLLRRQKHDIRLRYFNVLVVDELTARMLLRGLRAPPTPVDKGKKKGLR